ncbi:MAG TPA: Ig-like domain-containing protein, partial [Gemmatimonadales bacterium]|nr:Ig-like domain-containing protein [Gemmatimonadales bacterium]
MRSLRLAPLVLLIATQGQNCTATLGPEGLCASLTLSPSEQQMAVGQNLIVRINGNLNWGQPVGQITALQWRSSSPKIATVDSTGTVHAVNPGQATIEVSAVPPSQISVKGMQVIVVR